MARLQPREGALAHSHSVLIWQPDPKSLGDPGRGGALCAGNVFVAGAQIAVPGTGLWDIRPPSDAVRDALHGFGWLDDLAALADGAARRRARDWTLDWVARHGGGRGPGWTPAATGRRLIRLLHHAPLVLNGLNRAQSEAVERALIQQARFLSRRWSAADPGLPRFEALTGLIYGAVCLNGMERQLDPALRGLDRLCDEEIDEAGAIAARNPEELLDIFCHLTWAEAALMVRGRTPGSGHRAAIQRGAPTLRALRHADGGLARFHGGGCGAEGRLDRALFDAHVRPQARAGRAMGFARLASGRTTVIVDADQPPEIERSQKAHAATLAFELTSGRRPVVVSCGPGAAFGEDWRRASRATPCHSTLAIEGYSSSRLGPQGGACLVERPSTVEAQHESGPEGQTLTAWHDGYRATHGLTHRRQLTLAYDGRGLAGEDTLGAFSREERSQFEVAMSHSRHWGIGFALRFHLHPDVGAVLDLGGASVSLRLRSGETWMFRHDGAANLTLEPSVYLDPGLAKPRVTKQIVLTARVMDYASLIKWSLAKAQGTGRRAPRDLDRDDPFGETATPWTRPR